MLTWSNWQHTPWQGIVGSNPTVSFELLLNDKAAVFVSLRQSSNRENEDLRPTLRAINRE